MRSPRTNASFVANVTSMRIDRVADDLMRTAGWSHETRIRVIDAMVSTPDELQRQQIEPIDHIRKHCRWVSQRHQHVAAMVRPT